MCWLQQSKCKYLIFMYNCHVCWLSAELDKTITSGNYTIASINCECIWLRRRIHADSGREPESGIYFSLQQCDVGDWRDCYQSRCVFLSVYISDWESLSVCACAGIMLHWFVDRSRHEAIRSTSSDTTHYNHQPSQHAENSSWKHRCVSC